MGLHDISIDSIIVQHGAWVKSVGHDNKSPLECLALIASEVGEAVNECRMEVPTDALGSELADIILRVCGLANELGIDLSQEIREKMEINQERGNKGRIY